MPSYISKFWLYLNLGFRGKPDLGLGCGGGFLRRGLVSMGVMINPSSLINEFVKVMRLQKGLVKIGHHPQEKVTYYQLLDEH